MPDAEGEVGMGAAATDDISTPTAGESVPAAAVELGTRSHEAGNAASDSGERACSDMNGSASMDIDDDDDEDGRGGEAAPPVGVAQNKSEVRLAGHLDEKGAEKGTVGVTGSKSVGNGSATDLGAKKEDGGKGSIDDGGAYVEKSVLDAHQHAVSAVRFSPCGTMLASCSADKTLRVWDVESGKCKVVLTGHVSGISDCAWSADSRFVSTASDDFTVRIWDAHGGGRAVRVLRGHFNAVFCVAYNPQSSVIASGSFDETVKLWEVRTGECIRTLAAHSDPVTAVNFNADGSLIVTCSYDGLFRIWDAFTGQCLRTLVDKEDMPMGFARFTPNGKFILTTSLDSHVRLWNFTRQPQKCMKTYVGHLNTKHCLSVAFSCVGNDGSQQVVAGSEDNDVFVWDLQTKRVIQVLRGHADIVLGVDCHPSRRLIASAGSEKDSTVRIWEERGPHVEKQQPSRESRETGTGDDKN